MSSLLGRACQAGDDPVAPHPPDAGGVGAGAAPALLLAGVEAPRAHRALVLRRILLTVVVTTALWARPTEPRPDGCLLGSYRIATAPEPNSSRPTSFKSSASIAPQKKGRKGEEPFATFVVGVDKAIAESEARDVALVGKAAAVSTTGRPQRGASNARCPTSGDATGAMS